MCIHLGFWKRSVVSQTGICVCKGKFFRKQYCIRRCVSGWALASCQTVDILITCIDKGWKKRYHCKLNYAGDQHFLVFIYMYQLTYIDVRLALLQAGFWKEFIETTTLYGKYYEIIKMSWLNQFYYIHWWWDLHLS